MQIPAIALHDSTPQIVRHTAISDYLSLLALLLQFPTADVKEGLLTGTIGEDFIAISAEAGFEQSAVSAVSEDLRRISLDMEDDPDRLRTIRREHTRLFNHPEDPVIRIFEGVFLDEEIQRNGKQPTGARIFINPAALDAERCYRNAGLKKSSTINIPADCITTELEFLSHLHAEKARALSEANDELLNATNSLLEEFVRLHVRKWIPRFFERCKKESRCALYTTVGAMGCILFDPDLEKLGSAKTA